MKDFAECGDKSMVIITLHIRDVFDAIRIDSVIFYCYIDMMLLLYFIDAIRWSNKSKM